MIDQLLQAEQAMTHNEQYQPLRDTLHQSMDLDEAYQDIKNLPTTDHMIESPRQAEVTTTSDITQTAEATATLQTEKIIDNSEKFALLANTISELNGLFASILLPYDQYKNALQHRDLMIYIQSGRFDFNRLSMNSLGENVRNVQRVLLDTTQNLDSDNSHQEKLANFNKAKQSIDYIIQSVQNEIHFAILEVNKIVQDTHQQKPELTPVASQLEQILNGLQKTADSFLDMSLALTDQAASLSNSELATV